MITKQKEGETNQRRRRRRRRKRSCNKERKKEEEKKYKADMTEKNMGNEKS